MKCYGLYKKYCKVLSKVNFNIIHLVTHNWNLLHSSVVVLCFLETLSSYHYFGLGFYGNNGITKTNTIVYITHDVYVFVIVYPHMTKFHTYSCQINLKKTFLFQWLNLNSFMHIQTYVSSSHGAISKTL